MASVGIVYFYQSRLGNISVYSVHVGLGSSPFYRLHCRAFTLKPDFNPQVYVKTTELERSRKCSYYSKISGRALIRVPPPNCENVCLPHTVFAWRDRNNFLQNSPEDLIIYSLCSDKMRHRNMETH